MIGSYVDGVEQGHTTEWDDQGRVVVDGDYDAGKRIGLWLLTYEGGDVRCGPRSVLRGQALWTLDHGAPGDASHR
jgi:antitoxin component YwqK of YwqJK toxin-antitoxin module